MSDSELHDLLYPKEGGGREQRLKRLRKMLDDPAERAALDDYLARRLREREEAKQNADAVWDCVAHGSTDSLSVSSVHDGQAVRPTAVRPTEADELAALSGQLALGLGARNPRGLPLPVRIWVPALIGVVLGALAMWSAYTVLPQMNIKPRGTFAAALSMLIVQQQPSADELAAIDGLLSQYADATGSGKGSPRLAMTGKVYDLLREYQPNPDEIREARKLVGVYTPPGG